MNQEICVSSFQQGSYCWIGFRGWFPCGSSRYLIVIYFEGEIFCPNRPVLMILYGLDTLQLTQEKEKCSVAQCSTGWFKNSFLECMYLKCLPENYHCTCSVGFFHWACSEGSHHAHAEVVITHALLEAFIVLPQLLLGKRLWHHTIRSMSE